MKNLTFDEFKKSCFYTRLFIHIPALDSKINKEKFVTKNKYDFKKEQETLKQLYNENIEK